MRILVIGATSTIASECERLWAQTPGTHITLVGRNTETLQNLGRDLGIRYPQSTTNIVQCDFSSPKDIANAIQGAGDFELALIAHGDLIDQQVAQSNLGALEQSLETNAISVALFAEAIVQQFDAKQRGTLAIIGSVAGDRARKSNYAYGAAKAFVDSYTRGLQHRFAQSPIVVIAVKPGPTASKMTLSMPNPPKGMATAEQVAADIVRTCAKGKSTTIYTPRKWQLIMLIIRNLPTVVFNRLNI